MYSLFDKGIIEWIGPYGLSYNINRIIITNSRNQTGLVYHYFGLMVLSIIIFIIYLLNLL